MQVLSIVTHIKKQLSTFSDNFNRTNSTGLGQSSSGSFWETIRGTWNVATNVASTSGAASTYPIAAVSMVSTNVTASVAPSVGTGIAFWLSDSGNWWGINTDASSYTYYYSCNCGTTYYSCNCSTGYACGGYTSTLTGYTCNGYATGYNDCPSQCAHYVNGTPPYTYYTCCGAGYFYTYCTGYSPTYSTSCSGYYSYTSCQTCSSYSCGTCSATGYNYYLRLIKSIANTVTTVASAQMSSIAAIKVITSGRNITGKAYTDAGMTASAGTDLTNTAPVDPPGGRAGIILAPAAALQGTTLDNVSITSP